MIPCLLVTSDKGVRDVLKVGLEQTQTFTVDTVDDTWATEMVRSKPYEVVIVDPQRADGGDGTQILTEIRGLAPDANLLLVARGRSQNRFLARERQQLGIYALVHVPVEPVEFFETIARLLERIAQQAA